MVLLQTRALLQLFHFQLRIRQSGLVLQIQDSPTESLEVFRNDWRPKECKRQNQHPQSQVLQLLKVFPDLSFYFYYFNFTFIILTFNFNTTFRHFEVFSQHILQARVCFAIFGRSVYLNTVSTIIHFNYAVLFGIWNRVDGYFAHKSYSWYIMELFCSISLSIYI